MRQYSVSWELSATLRIKKTRSDIKYLEHTLARDLSENVAHVIGAA